MLREATGLLILCLVGTCRAIPIDNGVIGQPDVVCLEDSIRLLINTQRPFVGHVYVKGLFRGARECHSDYTRLPGSHQEMVFDVPYRGDCGVRRERSVNPPGLAYKATVVVQFHHLFVTKVDGAFSITCFYRETEKRVTQQLRVSMLPTTEVQALQEMPSCVYQVLLGSVNGPQIRYAQIGDKLVHKWSCDASTHGILVHSCFARDAIGTEYRLLDERGCSEDAVALGDLTYSSDLSMAWVDVHAFKFADELVIHFQCQITVCTKVENGCEGITPPLCRGIAQPPAPPSAITFSPIGAARPPPFVESAVDSGGALPSARHLPVAAAVAAAGRSYDGRGGIDSSGLIPFARRKRQTSRVLRSLNVSADDLVVFNLDDNVAPATGEVDKPTVWLRQATDDVCVSRLLIGQTVAIAALVFFSAFTVFGICQRRYYLELSNRKRNEFPEVY